MGNEIFFEGKKYISARRASQISGYNSDYIGQLCRKSQLECKLVGRGWFVSESSLIDHQNEAAKSPRGRIANVPTSTSVPVADLAQKKVEAISPVTSVMVVEQAAKPVSETPSLLLATQPVAEEASVALNASEPVAETPIASSAEAAPREIFVFDIVPPRHAEPVSDAVSIPINFSQTEHQAFSSEDRKAFHVVSPYFEPKGNFFKKTFAVCVVMVITILSVPFILNGDPSVKAVAVYDAGTKIAKEINVNASAQLASISSSIAFVGFTFSNDSDVIHSWRIKTHELTLQVYHRLSLLPASIFDTAGNMKRLVLRDSSSITDQAPDQSVSKTSDQGESSNIMKDKGITVVPSTGDVSKDEKLKQYIKDSFSDETRIVPDSTGQSGVIKPIFKKHSDSDYLYVIVPVRSP